MNKGDRGGRENCGLATQPLLPCPALPPHSIPVQEAPTAQTCPRPLEGQPHTQAQPPPGDPWHSLLAGGAKLTETSLTAQPQVILTHAGPVKIQTQGLEEGKGTNFQPRPTGKGRA